MLDIAHASHHLEYLQRAEATGNLPRGLSVEPRMMLVSADETTTRHWKEQTKANTLGYMRVAMAHYQRIIEDRTQTIADVQRQTLETINDHTLTELKTKALKGTYEQLLHSATDDAKMVRLERAQASEEKLRGGVRGPQTKRQRTNNNGYVEHTHNTLVADKIHSLYETAPLMVTRPRDIDPTGDHPQDRVHHDADIPTDAHHGRAKMRRKKPVERDSDNMLQTVVIVVVVCVKNMTMLSICPHTNSPTESQTYSPEALALYHTTPIPTELQKTTS